ncbi:MAG: glycosyltransferase family 2 protein [Fibrobacter sp.]|nr:glycosyltransferase family 2 protein [Fibrobacter sp.]
MNDLVSVIIPVYKVEPYLRECLDSVVNQTYYNLEIILVDDGSPDDCPKICDEYAENDSRIKVIHKENGGLSDARNCGIDIASGKYLTFVDSDDVIHSLYVESLYNALCECCADVSVCQYVSFVKNESIPFGENCVDVKTLVGRDAVIDLYNRQCRFSYKMKFGVPIQAWGKLYRKELFEQICFPFGKIHEDQFIVPLILYRAKNVAVISKNLYFYRKVEHSIMKNHFSLKRFDDLEAVSNCIDFFKKKKELEIVNVAEKCYTRLSYLYYMMARIANLEYQLPRKYKVNFVKVFLWQRNNSLLNMRETIAYLFPCIYRLYKSIKH